MKLQFPAVGPVEVVVTAGVTQFVSAPADASFGLTANMAMPAVGRPYEMTDDCGTTLTYLVWQIDGFVDGRTVARGRLVGVEHTPIELIREHDEKISAAIDKAFEAGQAVGRQEADEEASLGFDMLDEPHNAFVRFADGSFQMFLDVDSISEVDGELTFGTVEESVINVHPSWRSYSLEPILEDEATEQDGVGNVTVNVTVNAGDMQADVDMLSALSAKLGDIVVGQIMQRRGNETVTYFADGSATIEDAEDEVVNPLYTGDNTKGPAEACTCDFCAAESFAEQVWGEPMFSQSTGDLTECPTDYRDEQVKKEDAPAPRYAQTGRFEVFVASEGELRKIGETDLTLQPIDDAVWPPKFGPIGGNL